MMKAIVFEQFGEPADVLRVRDVPLPEPGPGEVRVRMIASPINPSDLLVVRGRYGVLPRLPATPGFEGVGVVEKVGPGLLGRLVQGKRVVAINGKGGNWAEYAVIPARQARPVAPDLPDEQVASFFVNPATVLAMVRHVLRVPKGEWLLQAAAGSALGRMIIKLGRHDGFKTLNVVRRREAIAELKALGGDAVVASADGPIDEQVRRIAGAEGVRYALDPVGGDTGTAIFQALAAEGRMLVYGTLSQEPLRIDPRGMIAGHRVVEGFWLGHWMPQRSLPAALLLFRTIAQLIRAGVLATEIGATFPLDAISDATRAAEAVGRHGKVLLKIGAS
jgi:NADPH:quinone reductase-like Zn-dependent oxidoreductase